MNSITMEMEPVERINPAEYNPRQISDDEFRKLVKGLAEFGIVEPLVVNHDGTLIGGHQRLKGAVELGWTEVPVIRVNLDKKKEKALNLALNRLGGAWDYGKLTNMLNEFESDLEFDIELTGFDIIEAADLTEVRGADPTTLAGSFDANMPHTTPTPPAQAKPIIQYNIVFGDEAEQATWNAYLKWLKGRYPDTDTIAQRIVADIGDRISDG